MTFLASYYVQPAQMFALLIIVVTILLLLKTRRIVNLVRFLILARRLPSPKSVPFIGHLELMTASFSERIIGRYFHECPRFYTIWLGPIPMVFLRDPRDVEIILGSGIHDIQKSFVYNFFRAITGDGLGNSKAEKWKQHRKLLNPAFHIKILESYTEVFARKSEILVQKLEKEVGQKSFNCNTYFSRAVVDVIYETILEKESKCLDEDKTNKIIKGFQLLFNLMVRRTFSPWLYLDIIYWNTSSGKECKKKSDDTKKELQEIINHKRQKLELTNKSKQYTADDELLGMKKKTGFLDLMLDASKNGVQLSEIDIMDEISFFLIAGSDTVRVTLCWTMQILGNHPEIQDKIYEELENIFQGSNRSHTIMDLNEMKYLERVIKEVLRLYPVLPFISASSLRDLEIGGYTIPAGMTMNISIYHVHRNQEIYPNPEKFDPDRFHPQSEQRHPYAYLPFSAGPRNCIGQKFAMLELKTMLSYIIRNYKIHSLREKVTTAMGLLIIAKEGFHISITKRNAKDAT